MPVYEYSCESCRHEFEALVRSMDQEPDVSCPECGKRRIRRRLSVFAAREGAARPALAAASGCGRPQCGGGQCQMSG